MVQTDIGNGKERVVFGKTIGIYINKETKDHTPFVDIEYFIHQGHDNATNNTNNLFDTKIFNGKTFYEIVDFITEINYWRVAFAKRLK